MKQILSALLGGLLLSGCATWTFTPIRSSRYVNEEGVFLYVDYGREEHESTFVAPNGLELPFRTKLKVRVTAPDGRRFVAWQVIFIMVGEIITNIINTDFFSSQNNKKAYFLLLEV